MSKSQDFSTGVNPWFWYKTENFLFLFQAKYAEKKLLLLYFTKKKSLQTKKRELEKNRKSGNFFKRVSLWFWSKIRIFFPFSCFRQNTPGNMYDNILERKRAFQLVYIAQKGVFSLQNIIKHIFLAYIAYKYFLNLLFLQVRKAFFRSRIS